MSGQDRQIPGILSPSLAQAAPAVYYDATPKGASLEGTAHRVGSGSP